MHPPTEQSVLDTGHPNTTTQKGARNAGDQPKMVRRHQRLLSLSTLVPSPDETSLQPLIVTLCLGWLDEEWRDEVSFSPDCLSWAKVSSLFRTIGHWSALNIVAPTCLLRERFTCASFWLYDAVLLNYQQQLLSWRAPECSILPNFQVGQCMYELRAQGQLAKKKKKHCDSHKERFCASRLAELL